jgi:ribonuclease-3
MPSDLIVVFRTQSDIEARIVRGLLEAHGIESIQSSAIPQSIFPLSVEGLGDIRLAVRDADAAEALRIIDTHRAEVGGEVVRIRDEFLDLEKRVGYRFRDRGLLEHALTHRSRAHEDVSGGVKDNESMEFLGDAVLGLVTADMLFREFPTYDEGQKSKLKASLVSAPALASHAEKLDLGRYLLLGRGEEMSGGRRKLALLADGFEALIAAIYLDGGLEPARLFILREFSEMLDEVRTTGAVPTLTTDHKSALQEWLQSHNLALPEYRLAGETGPDHQKLFEVDVLVRGSSIARARGRSKKEAEQRAAEEALKALQHRG